jgi:hypothetical protein
MQTGRTTTESVYLYDLDTGDKVFTDLTLENSVMESEGHDLRLKGKSDTGGPFWLDKHVFTRERIDVPLYQTWYGSHLGGNFVAHDGYRLTEEFLHRLPSRDGLEAASRSKAPTAIALSNPSRPEMDLGVAVVETVRDGIPRMIGHSLWRDHTLTAKHAGDEYLN